MTEHQTNPTTQSPDHTSSAGEPAGKVDSTGDAAQEEGAASNGGVLLARAGNVAGVALVAATTVVRGVGSGGMSNAAAGAGYFAAALGCSWVARKLSNALLFPWLDERVRAGNTAAGVVSGANALGFGIVASHCFSLDALSNLHIAVVFFFVSHLALVALAHLFRALTYYADDEEIIGENVAVAVSHAGLFLALAIVVGHGASGAFLGWTEAIIGFGAFLGWAALLYPVRQVLVAKCLLGLPLAWRSRELDVAIARDRQVPMAVVEAVGYLTLALVVVGTA